MAEVKFLAIVIAIQQQSGGNLAEALANLSGVLRDRFKMGMKVKADFRPRPRARPWCWHPLPPGVMLMVYMSVPDYIKPLFATKTGNFMPSSPACSGWASASMVMRKMINFKF